MNELHQKSGVYSKDFKPGPSIDGSKSPLANNQFIFFKKKGIFMKVHIKDIIYIQAERNYTYTITKEEKYMNTSTLSQMEERFTSPNFMRVHRSYIVNLDNLTAIDFSNNKIFFGEYEVPFSRTLKDQLAKKFNLIK